MTIAEIHGKLSPQRPNGCNDRMEDLLTSDVFGTMKYAGWDYGFLDWLRSATDAWGSSLTAKSVLPSDESVERIHFLFWPKLENNREPDLILGIELKNGSVVQVMVEVKYFSGTSDFDCEIEGSMPEETGNQIAAQVNSFPKEFSSQHQKYPVQACCHIFITTHFSLPSDDYEKATSHIANHIPMFWLSWHTLTNFLKSHEHMDVGKEDMIKDLITLLERKELIPYRGLSGRPDEDFSKYFGIGFWKVKKKGWWEIVIPQHPVSGHYWR